MSIINNLNFSFSKKPDSCYRKRPTSRWKIWTSAIASLIIIVTLGVFYFIYNNIYLTITNVNAIYFLQANNETNNVDMAAYEKAKQYLDKKSNPPVMPKNLRNIFSYQNSNNYESTSTSSR